MGRTQIKKLAGSLILISAIAVVTLGATRAFFSDTETSANNILQAGALDLKIDNESYYNGEVSTGTTWAPTDLTNELFFNFLDLKPGDYGEDTISISTENDAWVCMNVDLTEDDDEDCTEPELEDDPNCADPGPDEFDGELGSQLSFIWWADDGDNVLESGEKIFRHGSPLTLFDGTNWAIADSAVNIWGEEGPIPGSETVYIGKAWCLGTIDRAPLPQSGYDSPADDNDGNNTAGEPEDGGLTCDGALLNNASQTDKLMADIEFTAVQARHNEEFLCPNGRLTPTPTKGTTTPRVSPTNKPSPTITPTPTVTPTLSCSQADVMLVLDRSGSISSPELTNLKTAANDFVDSLGITTSGVHAGMSSFATTGSLNHHLLDNEATLIAAINALSSGGFTNLKEGIDLAAGEFANPGDGHDRADGTSPDFMIIITDGHPNRPEPAATADDLAAASATAFKAGGTIFVVGVGADVNTSYLQGIATSSDHYYSSDNYSELETTLENLDLCNGAN